jgi:hypothetical protein
MNEVVDPMYATMNVPMHNNESNVSVNALGSPSRFLVSESRSIPKCPGRRGSMQTSSSSALSPAMADNDFVNKRATLNESTNTLDWKPLKPRRIASTDRGENLKLDDSSVVSILTTVSDITDPSAFNSLRLEHFESFRCFYGDDDEEDGSDIKPREQDPLHAPLRAPFRAPFHDLHQGRDIPPRPCVRDPIGSSNSDTPARVLQRDDSETSHRELSIEINLEHQAAPCNKDLPPRCPKPSTSLRLVAPSLALAKLAQVFVSGCPVDSHSYHLKKYEETFVGSDAVDFMIEANLASTREDAVFLGQRLCKDMNLFHHVCWDHTFKDGCYFYRFTDEAMDDLSSLPAHVTLKELRTIAESFVRDMNVSSHVTMFMKYKDTFLGSEAVDHMVSTGLASSREHAVYLGQRLLEELGVFHHITHDYQFKDDPYLYRFTKEESASVSSGDSASITTLMSTLNTMYSKRRSKHPLSLSDHSTDTSISIGKKTSSPVPRSLERTHGVSFGDIQERSFVRCLELNPSTSSGPSVGLGWQYYDYPSVPILEKPSNSSRRQFRLSSDDRKQILNEWGHSNVEIRKATKANEKIREQRKQTLNKLTIKTNFVAK